jgi:hypothetical protein
LIIDPRLTPERPTYPRHGPRTMCEVLGSVPAGRPGLTGQRPYSSGRQLARKRESRIQGPWRISTFQRDERARHRGGLDALREGCLRAGSVIPATAAASRSMTFVTRDAGLCCNCAQRMPGNSVEESPRLGKHSRNRRRSEAVECGMEFATTFSETDERLLFGRRNVGPKLVALDGAVALCKHACRFSYACRHNNLVSHKATRDLHLIPPLLPQRGL